MTKQPEPHKFVPMSQSETGSVICGKHYQFDEGHGAYCGEPPDHLIHNVEQPERSIEYRARELALDNARAMYPQYTDWQLAGTITEKELELAKRCILAEEQRDQLAKELEGIWNVAAQRDQAEALLLQLWESCYSPYDCKKAESLLRSRGLL